VTARGRRVAAALGVAVALTVPVASGVAPASAADLPVPERPAAEVDRTIRNVLSRAEYKRAQPSPIERARTWLRDQVSGMLASLFRGDRGTVVAWAILGGLLVTAVVLSIRFARTMTPDPGVPARAAAMPRRSGREWRTEADAHERAGEWREALRARYRALVADLAARGLVDEVPGRTAGEYRIEVSESMPRAAPEFGGATELFERAWYGNRPTGAAEAEQFRGLEERVLQEVG
jgi:hypothetical protein